MRSTGDGDRESEAARMKCKPRRNPLNGLLRPIKYVSKATKTSDSQARLKILLISPLSLGTSLPQTNEIIKGPPNTFFLENVLKKTTEYFLKFLFF